MKVLIIPEDQTHDRYITEAVIEQMMKWLGCSAHVDVLGKPQLRGVTESLNASRLAEIVRENPMIDLFILVADQDCDRTRPSRVTQLAERLSEHPGKVLGVLAVQELEVWMLAPHAAALVPTVAWKTVRAECDSKEKFADDWLEREFQKRGPGDGRKAAMRNFGQTEYKALRSKCDEVKALEREIAAWLNARRKP